MCTHADGHLTVGLGARPVAGLPQRPGQELRLLLRFKEVGLGLPQGLWFLKL